jgi:hypothetical protein
MTETVQSFADLCSFYGSLGAVSAVLDDMIAAIESGTGIAYRQRLQHIAGELDGLRGTVRQQAEGKSREMGV